MLETMLDVVKRYDIDGVHIDDYFYPYIETRTVVRRVRRKRIREKVEIPFPDDRTWKKYGRAQGFTDRGAWRRSNIDDFVRSLYRGVKAIKPATLVGISPFGIWRSGVPEGVKGLDAYSEIYADSRKLARRGLARLHRPAALLAGGRISGPIPRAGFVVAIGEHAGTPRLARALHVARLWRLRRVAVERDSKRDRHAARRSHGQRRTIRATFIFDWRRCSPTTTISRATLRRSYRERALVPASPWLVARAPAAPLVSVVNTDGPARFIVTPGDSVRVRWWLIQTRGRDGRWTTKLRPAGEGRLDASALGTNEPDELAVTAIGVAGVASPPTLISP